MTATMNAADVAEELEHLEFLAKFWRQHAADFPPGSPDLAHIEYLLDRMELRAVALRARLTFLAAA